MEIRNNRIEILDSLRVIAILMVMIYHFYSRYNGTHYSYSFRLPLIFNYGYLGVELFFIISGFVITLTLTKCKNFLEFIKKRFIRLIPGMLICSTVTFLVMIIFDSDSLFMNSKSVTNLLISNTFIPPSLIRFLFDSNIQYIDGSYWSLWVELQFYIFGGIIYFLSPRYFLRNYTFLGFVGVISWYCFNTEFGFAFLGNILGRNIFSAISDLLKLFSISKYALWFLLGIIIFKLYYKKDSTILLYSMIIVFFIQMFLLSELIAIIFTMIVMILFLLFIYNQKLLHFLSNKILMNIGIASYSIYLIHENIGVLILNKASKYFGVYNWILPIVLIFFFSILGIMSYKYLENPLGKILRIRAFKKT